VSGYRHDTGHPPWHPAKNPDLGLTPRDVADGPPWTDEREVPPAPEPPASAEQRARWAAERAGRLEREHASGYHGQATRMATPGCPRCSPALREAWEAIMEACAEHAAHDRLTPSWAATSALLALEAAGFTVTKDARP
jgi:hypothetical protein